jgi:hypothetical protein
MNFDTLRTSDFVKWNREAIERNGMKLDCPQMWEQEPLDCIMQVIQVKYVNYEPRITLDCTQDCGCHIFYELGREDYETYSKDVGGDMLGFVDSLTELSDSFIPEEEKGYDFAEDYDELLKQVVLGILPTNRRRTT